jgi:hypothetical protein
VYKMSQKMSENGNADILASVVEFSILGEQPEKSMTK